MLWLCVHLPRLPLEALSLVPSAVPRAVTASRGNRRWIVCADRDDPALAPGQDAGAAQGLLPELTFVARNPRAERAALQAVATVAWRIGQPVSLKRIESREVGGVPEAMVWVEIQASLRLFGGLKACTEALSVDLDALGHAHHLGVAPTPEGAALFARANVAAPARDLDELLKRLRGLPAQTLALPAEALSALRGTGHITVGDVLAIPREAWARRFAADALGYLDRLTGRSPDARRAWRPPARYERRLELPHEVTSTEGLLFPLKRLTQEFAHYLRARDTGALEFELRYGHDDGPPTLQLVRLTAPSRDAAHLWQVARERLERVEVTQPVQDLALHARAFAEPDVPQYDLFDRQAHEQGEWQRLVERLSARLGRDAVVGLGLVADHRPERCWKTTAPEPKKGSDPFSGRQAPFPPRPVWLLDPPRPLGGAPAVAGNAERIETGWWDGNPASRDYYCSESGGARLWVYRDRATRRWFLHGLWA